MKNIIDRFRQDLNRLYPQGEVMQFIYLLADDYLGWDKTTLHINYNTILTPRELEKFNLALQRLSEGEPIQYILGKAWFDGLVFMVTPQVLIPRPETAELCELIKVENSGKAYEEFAILDIGTGSGCIPVSLKRAFPHTHISALDKMEAAIGVARENARFHNADILFHQFDILNETIWNQLGQFDLIVSNPPYVLDGEKSLMHKNVVDYEPHEALYVLDEDPLLFYRSIISFAWQKLNRPGMLYLEINEKFGGEVKNMVRSAGFEKAEVIKDFNGRDRFVRAETRTAILDTSYWYADKP